MLYRYSLGNVHLAEMATNPSANTITPFVNGYYLHGVEPY